MIIFEQRCQWPLSRPVSVSHYKCWELTAGKRAAEIHYLLTNSKIIVIDQIYKRPCNQAGIANIILQLLHPGQKG